MSHVQHALGERFSQERAISLIDSLSTTSTIPSESSDSLRFPEPCQLLPHTLSPSQRSLGPCRNVLLPHHIWNHLLLPNALPLHPPGPPSPKSMISSWVSATPALSTPHSIFAEPRASSSLRRQPNCPLSPTCAYLTPCGPAHHVSPHLGSPIFNSAIHPVPCTSSASGPFCHRTCIPFPHICLPSPPLRLVLESHSGPTPRPPHAASSPIFHRHLAEQGAGWRARSPPPPPPLLPSQHYRFFLYFSQTHRTIFK